MKIGRVLTKNGKIVFCAQKDDGRICEFDPEKKAVGTEIDIERLLAPVMPTKIVAVGLNYRDHAKEFNLKIPEEPLLFLKPQTSVIGPNEDIVYPKGVAQLDYEAELGIVISKKCRSVSPEKVSDYILGYTCFNDVTARDLQAKDGQWTRAKSFDTFAPIGPWIVTDIENPGSLKITSSLNGQIKQSSNTSNMIFDVFTIVSFVSQIMTLEAHDVIATGTPPGVGPMQPGDTITISIEKIGELTNKVVRR
jgi:2-keto-4-pentenoate hydratase/2-oxohepta-3-ene-1,7-dioic acid hydratase in catechol pathway